MTRKQVVMRAPTREAFAVDANIVGVHGEAEQASTDQASRNEQLGEVLNRRFSKVLEKVHEVECLLSTNSEPQLGSSDQMKRLDEAIARLEATTIVPEHDAKNERLQIIADRLEAVTQQFEQTAEIQRLNDIIAILEAEIKVMVKRSNKKSKQHEEVTKALEKTIQCCSQKIEELTTANNSQSEEIKSRSGENELLQQKNADSKKNIESLLSTLTTLKQEKEGLVTDFEALTKKIELTQEQLCSLEDKNADLLKANMKFSLERSDLKAEICALSNQKADTEAEKGKLTAENETLKTSISVIQESLEGEITTLKAASALLEKQNESLVAQNQKSSSDNHHPTREYVNYFELRVRELESKVANQKININSLLRKVERKNAEIDGLQEAKKEVEGVVENNDKVRISYTASILKYARKESAQYNHNAYLKDQISKLQGNVARLEDKNQLVINRNYGLKKDCDFLDSKCQTLENDNIRLLADRRHYMKECRQLEKRDLGLEDQLNRLGWY